jgi:hypothetical protein
MKLNMALSEEQKEWLNKILYDFETIKKIPEELLTEEFCLAAVQRNGMALQFVPDALKTEALCLAALRQDGSALAYVPEALKTEVLCLVAVQTSFHWNEPVLQYVPEALKTEDMCLAAVQHDNWALRYVPEALKTEAFMAKISLLRAAISSGSGGSGYGIDLIKPIS